ncbi:heavy metal-associated isoprenylated plant protein 47 [Brachypodium distachyon]|uniref:HMA domain-containing protein n=1 Tax=Brachypodium distachyon TaxID=15368 RepID=I1IB03_BRADI|nr:heavy metal-associated isoprenylated plant protein 47 [Brachypodium distachyon]KQK00075.1 hypothetical protein BRADI_3g47200v3 [Brachypodium distachyon]|eukprot:XP_003572665.1 heavy metal-associated isoprenylated plant protein 47 [Brachypodium distachyon]
MAQKIVIRVQMTCDKCRSKAMALVAAFVGVNSVSLAGDDKDQVVVVGDGVDSVKLTSALRKKVGPAELLQVGDTKKEEPEKVKNPEGTTVVEYTPYPWQCYHPYPSQPVPVCEYPAGTAYGYHSRPGTCSIM